MKAKELTLHRAKSITGWMSDAELLFLAEIARKSKLIYEIGSYMGRSTRALGDNIKENGIVYAIDPWEIINFNGDELNIIFETTEVVYNMFYCNNHDLINSGKIVPVKSTWKNYDPYREYQRYLADFIFIDGSHIYKDAKEDVQKALKYIDLGGIIAGHDYDYGWPGVVRAVNEVFSNKKINLVDSIWWVNL